MTKLDQLFNRWRIAIAKERYAPAPLTADEVMRVRFASTEKTGQASYPPALIARACRRVEEMRLKA